MSPFNLNQWDFFIANAITRIQVNPIPIENLFYIMLEVSVGRYVYGLFCSLLNSLYIFLAL